MADEKEVELEVEQEPTVETVVEPETPVAAVPEVDPALEELRRSLETERAARRAAEQQAREAHERANRASTEAEDTQLTLVKNAIESVKRDTEIAKANFRAAMANGDYDAATEAQAELSTNAARLLRLEEGRVAMEAPKPAPRQQASSDPVEALASQLTPRSAAWVRAHPQYATDPRMNQRMIAAHNLAVTDGLEPDTDEYFESVETTLRIRRPAPAEPEPVYSEAAAPTQRRVSPAAAPVSRETVNGTRPNVIRLSSQEREMAQMMGMTDAEYAKNKATLIREGKLH